MARRTLLAVILNWRTPEMSLRAAEAALVAMEGIEGELVIVDNASGDGSVETIRDHVRAQGWSRVRVIASPVNGGFGAGNNIGIRAGLSTGERADYVYVLNSDAFPEPDAIRVLMDYLEDHPHVGFAGSFIQGPDGEAHLTAFRFPSVAGEFEAAARTGPISRLLAHRRVPMEIPSISRRVDWVAGASLMMRGHVLDRVGLFDENFFLYYEETDLCLRAARAGWITHYVRDSRVVHIGSVSTGMKDWARVPDYWFESRRYYFLKNHGLAYMVAVTAAHVAGGLIWRLRRLIQRTPPADPPGFLRQLIASDLGAAWRVVSGRNGGDGRGPGRQDRRETAQ